MNPDSPSPQPPAPAIPPAGSAGSSSLRKRFFIGTGIILLVFCSICALLLYHQGKLLLTEAAGAKSQIVMAAVEASQSYVREVLRPKMYELMGEDAFILEAMSTSFVSRVMMDRFGQAMPEYRYRRVAIDARNPVFEADPSEVEVIRYFEAHPEQHEWESIVRSDDDTRFMVYRPVRFTASCMHCHGDPAEAPRALVEQYGDSRGFWRQEGGLAGVMAVGIPVDVALASVKEKALSVLVGGFLVTGVLFLTLGFFFNRVVVHDLRNVLEVFRGGLRPDEEERFFQEIHSRDEITALKSAAQAMAFHLSDTRRQLEDNAAHLERSKELLQSVFDGISDMVILMDRDYHIKMVNKAYLKRYELTEADVLGQLCFDLHAGEACPCPNCGMQKAREARSPAVEEVVSSNGQIFLMHFYPVLDDQGDVASIVRYARDITDQKRVEQQIQQTEKLASVGQLAAGIAHEINNPLGVILCYTDLLRRQLAEDSQSLSDVATIEKHALNCQRIVSDLLKFARSEATTRQLASINRTIEEAVSMVAHQFSHKNIDIELDLEANLPLLNIDIAELKQVFLNLLMNSQQAIDHQGKIRIGTSQLTDTGQVQVRFWDNGSGIPAHILHKIFDPFFSTKAAGEGTGLGLSVSYGIIRDHGGEIQAASDPDQGTQFTILLPVSGQP